MLAAPAINTLNLVGPEHPDWHLSKDNSGVLESLLEHMRRGTHYLGSLLSLEPLYLEEPGTIKHIYGGNDINYGINLPIGECIKMPIDLIVLNTYNQAEVTNFKITCVY